MSATLMTKLEVLDANSYEWKLLVSITEGQTMSVDKKNRTVTVDWTTDGGLKVQTVYNLSMFPAYSIL